MSEYLGQPQQQPAPTPQPTVTPTTAAPPVSAGQAPATPAPQPQPEVPQTPQAPEIPQQQLIDPFYQSQLGQWLRGVSSGYDRSPYGQQQTVGDYIPGGPISGAQQPQATPAGGPGGSLPEVLQAFFQALGGGGGEQQQEYPGQYMPPVGPMEWTARSAQTNAMMNEQPDLYGQAVPTSGAYGGPSEQDVYLAQVRAGNRGGYNRRTGAAPSRGALHPERYDPYKGLYWWT